jgi:hypothetical protein
MKERKFVKEKRAEREKVVKNFNKIERKQKDYHSFKI